MGWVGLWGRCSTRSDNFDNQADGPGLRPQFVWGAYSGPEALLPPSSRFARRDCEVEVMEQFYFG